MMNKPVTMEALQAMSDFTQYNYRSPTYLYIKPDVAMKLIEENIHQYSGNTIFGLKMRIEIEMPENAKDRRLFVA